MAKIICIPFLSGFMTGSTEPLCEENIHDIVTPIDVNKYEEYLGISGFSPSASTRLVYGFRNGFDIGYRGSLNRKHLSKNIPIRVGSPAEMWDKLLKEVKLRRYASPFKSIPYQNFVQSPISLVPKAGNKTRLIFHLSYDFGKQEEEKSINYHTPDDLCMVKYRDIDYAIRSCLHINRLATGGEAVAESDANGRDGEEKVEIDTDEWNWASEQCCNEVHKTLFFKKRFGECFQDFTNFA